MVDFCLLWLQLLGKRDSFWRCRAGGTGQERRARWAGRGILGKLHAMGVRLTLAFRSAAPDISSAETRGLSPSLFVLLDGPRDVVGASDASFCLRVRIRHVRVSSSTILIQQMMGAWHVHGMLEAVVVWCGVCRVLYRVVYRV